MQLANRPGAAGLLAAEYASRAAPDGYTLFMSTTSVWTILPNVKKSLPYDAVNGFLPVTRIASASNVMVINPALSATSAADPVKLAKASPGAINYASAGIATPAHLVGERFNLLADVRERISATGAVPVTETPEQFGAFMATERKRLGDVISKTGIVLTD